MMPDKDLQLKLLERLSESYPDQITLISDDYPDSLDATMNYLMEHGLVTARTLIGPNGRRHFQQVGLTAYGVDFLDSTGGITAIKKTVQIKPNVEMFLALLKGSADKANEPMKSKIRDFVKEFATPIGQGLLLDVLKKLMGLS
jgi:hypothetical protein